MNKKTTTVELEIPQTDLDCWNRYPRHRWVYELSRLYDSQHIAWSTVKTEELDTELNNLSSPSIPGSLGKIYVKKQEKPLELCEVYILKGEIKQISHANTCVEKGETEIRIAAFVSLYFSKFTGVITAELSGKDIIRISLKPQSELDRIKDKELVKLIKRIYKKQETTVIGLTDRDLRESLAS